MQYTNEISGNKNNDNYKNQIWQISNESKENKLDWSCQITIKIVDNSLRPWGKAEHKGEISKIDNTNTI